MNCPEHEDVELEFVSGTYSTGVVAPDGVRETLYQEGYYCPRCEVTYDPDDVEPSRIPCSFPKCERLTTFDPTYGDLCYEHIRANNE